MTMKKAINQSRLRLLVTSAVVVANTAFGIICYADNPIIQTKYTADPDPVVYDDVVYLFTSHDEDDARGHSFKMKNWMVYTTTDMINWTDHGIVAGIEEPYNTFSWVDRNSNSAWAPKAITRNGKWYLYVCFVYKRHLCIGVAVADNPFGPYVDPLGKPLIYGNTPANDYDPAPIIDDDGQAYLYWGGGGATVPGCYYVKLNEDMISTSGSIINVVEQLPTFQEGPELWRHNSKYYLAWATTCCPEGVGYAMSDGPTGPWMYKGYIMDPNQKSSGNSCGYMDYKGNSYHFGFNYALLQQTTSEHHERRSVCVEQLTYNTDGTIVKNPWWSREGVSQIGTLNPYTRTEAETICWSSGIKTEPCSEGGMDVCEIDKGDYIKVKGVDFGDTSATTFTAAVASASAGGIIELRLDGADGKLIGSVDVPNTGEWQDWKSVTTNVSDITGIHDMYLVFKGDSEGHLFNFDYWQFGKKNIAVEKSAGINGSARNPVIWADFPDPAVIRVGDTYYMSNTTMHMCPGLLILKSKDLVNWEMASYAYQKLEDNDETTLQNGRNMYGKGSWASSLRYHDRVYYATTFALNTGKTYIFKTTDIESGKWEEIAFEPLLYDGSLFFDDDGRTYKMCEAGNIRLVELKADLSGIKQGGFDQVIIKDASGISGKDMIVEAEGAHLHKINGKYYLFLISWPRNDMRTQLVFRADKITGPYEGRIFLHDQGVAEGCLIDTPDGGWYAMLFQDNGAVGRTPFLVPVKWEDGWPLADNNGKVPQVLNIPVTNTPIPAGIASDEFNEGISRPGLQWQWNHNPDNRYWSLTQRPGFLRLTTGRVDNDFEQVRNMLTQRTFGPECSGTVAVDVSHMKDGDVTGLAALQKRYGIVGVKMTGDTRSIIMVSNESESPVELESVSLMQNTVYLRVDCDFKERTDKATFHYSLDGQTWTAIGKPLQMAYSLSHFVGYRFALFNDATKTAGGFVDFDYFRVRSRIDEQ